MTGATGNLYCGLHEFFDMMLLLHFLRGNDLFLDIGSNIGSYAILASGGCGASTWAFEPDPDAVTSLKRNVELNSLQRLITVQNIALGRSDCSVPFTVGHDTVNRVANLSDLDVRMVRQRPLDSVIEGRSPAMMKLDVEGYEEEVMAGANKTLENPALKIVVIETVTPNIRTQLNRNGFVEANYEPFSRDLQHGPRTCGIANVLFVRDWEFVTQRLSTARPVHVIGHTI
jgi:FkbM family methyltransferase